MSIDLLVRGGTLVTMDTERRVVVGDLRIRDGRIVALGPKAHEGPFARVLDARGCAVLPGLVQAHVHLCQALFRGMADDRALLPWLKERIWPLEAAHDPASLRASARLGLAEMLCSGTTTILDMGTVHHHDVVFEAMRQSGIRGLSGKAMMDRGAGVPKGLRETTKSSLDESDRLCARWHGSSGGRLRYAYAPRFILSCSERLLRGSAARAKQAGTLVHTHAAEHADERVAVREALGREDIDALADYGITGNHAILAHGVQLKAKELRALGRAGTRIVHCPSANMKLASGIAPVSAMRAAGIVVGLGADGAPCNNRMDPWTELRSASLLAKAKLRDATAMPALASLELATIDGARALGLDDEIGSLEIGKRGDVIVVDMAGLHTLPSGDMISRLVYAARAPDVKHVLVDGRVIVQRGELLTLDVHDVRQKAEKQAKRVRARAGC